LQADLETRLSKFGDLDKSLFLSMNTPLYSSETF